MEFCQSEKVGTLNPVSWSRVGATYLLSMACACLLVIFVWFTILSPANEVWGKAIFSQACVCPRRRGGICVQGRLGRHPPPQSNTIGYSKQVGGTHPTGMCCRASSSYFFLFFSAYSYFSYFLAISSYFSYFWAILLTISKYLLEIWTF